ncbi:MAG TPA: hypothetical protein VH682_11555 [Gemmataceae bacterium]
MDADTNGGLAWTPPSTVPARSDTLLVTTCQRALKTGSPAFLILLANSSGVQLTTGEDWGHFTQLLSSPAHDAEFHDPNPSHPRGDGLPQRWRGCHRLGGGASGRGASTLSFGPLYRACGEQYPRSSRATSFHAHP